MSASDAISPTAHYTGYVWARNGLSHPTLSTLQGRVLFDSLQPAMLVSRTLGRGTLEGYLLARHRAIDLLLERAIEEHGITQVIEVAAGLSPRGWRFTTRYGARLTYVEADLPAMAARKRRALQAMGSLNERHRVSEVDALRDDGPLSLAALASELDHTAGLAVITEGLLGYLPRAEVTGVWRRLADVLREFRSGRYLSDLHLGSVQNVEVRAFRVLLSAFVRSRVHLHFGDPEQAVAELRGAGFSAVELHRAVDVAGATRDSASALAHVIEASTG